MHKLNCILVLLAISSGCKIVFADGTRISPFNNYQDGLQEAFRIPIQCLDCLCDDYVGSDCDEKELCGNDEFLNISGTKQRVRNCDLLGITYKHWSAHKYLIAGDNETSIDAYPNCKRDPICSARVVNDYVAGKAKSRDTREKNGKNISSLTCLDYLMMYNNYGGKEYHTTKLSVQRQYRFHKCTSKNAANFENKVEANEDDK